MTKYETILNSIYCLSQEACIEIVNLRSVSSISKNIHSYTLYVLLHELKAVSLEAFKAIDLSEEQMSNYLDELFSIGSILKEIYDLFNISRDMAEENIALKRLEHRIGILIFALSKLYDLRNNTKAVGGTVFAVE